MSQELENLIRDVAMSAETDISIMLVKVTANDTDGFSGTVYRYPTAPEGSKLVGKRDPDPAAALRGTLIEYLRFLADEQRKYEQAPKYVPPVVDAIDACQQDDVDDLLG